MKTDLDKRLVELEKKIKSIGDSPIWVDGINATVRVDINHRRGKEVTFPTVYEARLWIEKMINTHTAGGILNYQVDNLADLFEDSEDLRTTLKVIIPDKIVVPDLEPRLVNGQITWQEKTGGANHPVVYDADNNFPGILAMLGITNGMTADICLWCFANLVKVYFGSLRFKERWDANQLSEADTQMFAACATVFNWDKSDPEEQVHREFAQLFFQVTKLPAKEGKSQ
jgi:hypothetical protein